MMAIDDMGRFISGDKLLAIFSLASGKKNIVTTVDASMSIDKLNFKVKRTKVGDPYVSEALKKSGAFGGEPSGAWVFPQISLCPDGIYAAAQITAIASRQKLSEMADGIPSYPVIRGNVSGAISSMSDFKDHILLKLKPDSIDSTDGLKIYFKGGWLLIRPSGTEPKIRLTAEADNQELARHLYQNGASAINESLQGCKR
jgi:phosphoglucosamine mutase